MSEFSEYFNLLKNNRNLNIVELARICELNTTTAYRWIRGEHLPKKWSAVERVVKKLQLSNKERKELQCAYEKTKLGDKRYYSYQKIIEILKLLQYGDNEYKSIGNCLIDHISVKSLPRFVEFHNKMEIMECIQTVLLYMRGVQSKNLYLKLQPVHQDIIMQIRMHCNQINECHIEEIACFQRENYNSALYNLSIVKGLINLILQKHQVDIYCMDKINDTENANENWILTDEFLIEFANDFSLGMLTTDANLIRHYKRHFKELKENCSFLGKKTCKNPNDFITSGQNEFGSYNAMEYMPCIATGMTKEILEQHIYKNLPGREELMELILIRNTAANQKKFPIRSFFCKDGLTEFMETGRIEIFPYEVYHRIEYSARCDIIQNAIDFIENENMEYYMIKSDRLFDMKNIYIEHYEGKSSYLIIDIQRAGQNKERFEIYSGDIINNFKEFFDFLTESGYVYTLEETREQMQQILDKYRKIE